MNYRYKSNRYDMDKIIISAIASLSAEKQDDPEKTNTTVDSLLKLVKDDMNKVRS